MSFSSQFHIHTSTPSHSDMKLAFLVAEKSKAKDYYHMMSRIYKDHAPEEADFLIVLGGDGFMLRSMRLFGHLDKPFYGVNCGNVGKLMNAIPSGDLRDKLHTAKLLRVGRLHVTLSPEVKEPSELFAFNEIAILRSSHRAVKLQVAIDGKTQLKNYSGDGILVSTPMGSLSYNYSVGGPILPFNSPLLSVMPINPYTPCHWRGALLAQESSITIKNMGSERRPFMITADNQEVTTADWITITKNTDRFAKVLFDKENSWHDSVLKMQFDNEGSTTSLARKPHNRFHRHSLFGS